MTWNWATVTRCETYSVRIRENTDWSDFVNTNNLLQVRGHHQRAVRGQPQSGRVAGSHMSGQGLVCRVSSCNPTTEKQMVQTKN